MGLGTWLVGMVVGAGMVPENSRAVERPDGANPAPYAALAVSQFQNRLVWVKATATGGLVYYASGFLYNERHVVMAGHAAFVNNTLSTINQVGTGTNYLTSPGSVSAVASLILYPGYNNTTYSNDLAVLRLVNPLPTQPLVIGSPTTGQVVTAAGFGRTGTPSGGMEPESGQGNAFQAPVDPLPQAGFPTNFFGINFSPAAQSLVPLNGAALAGDSGSLVVGPGGVAWGIIVARTGAASSQTGVTIVEPLAPFKSWLDEVALTFTMKRAGTNMVLTWSGANHLQSSSNLSAFADVPGATSPSTNALTTSPRRFFRLRGN